MPPGSAEVRHYHDKAQQFFYVLSGEAALEVGGRLVKLGTGQGVHIPPGVAHQMKNSSEQDLHFLVISQPPSHGDRVAAPCESS
jgi:mannose-6-phosphate isomerase-like protein (cupin superfamily)